MKLHLRAWMTVLIFGMMYPTSPTDAGSLRKTPPDLETTLEQIENVDPTPIRLWEGDKLLWKIFIPSETETATRRGKIAVFPTQRFLVYMDIQRKEGAPRLCARGFDGSVRWKRTFDEAADFMGRYFLIGGGDILILKGHGPWGGHWQSPDFPDADFINDGMAEYWVRAFRASTGDFLWMRTHRDIGEPIWTDGDTIVTIHKVPQPGYGHNRQTPIVYWLEKRQASNCRLI